MQPSEREDGLTILPNAHTIQSDNRIWEHPSLSPAAAAQVK